MSTENELGWPKRTLAALADDGILRAVSGYSSGEHNQDGVGVAHIRPFNVTAEGAILLTQIKSVPETKHSDEMGLMPRDVVFNNTNSEELVGKTALWRETGRFGFSNHMTRIRVMDASRFSPEFLALYLHYHWQTGASRMLCRRHVAQASIIGERFTAIPVVFPPIDEQRKIAAVLGKVQAAVAVEGDLVRVARELKQAALRQLFTRGLRHEPQKQTPIGPVPESWDVVPVAECVTPFRFDRKQQVPAAAYSETGRFPIVDQGKQAIAGYCDDETKVITPRPALIVFGDHTRCVKFVDFPFVLGSDGTKPLVANPEWDARTLFYALSSVDVESHGYNRHYKYLSEKLVARSPDPAEQCEIAALLATLDAKIAHHEARQALLRELFRTLLHDLLTARRRVPSLDLSEDFFSSNLTSPSGSPALG